MTRKSYVIALEIVPTAPLTHGSGVEGNEQILRTEEYAVRNADGEWDLAEVPTVSGAALKATLREWAVRDALERAGVGDGEASKDALRLLLKGGKNDSGGQTVSLEEARRLRDLFPCLSVFGSMDGGLPLPARVKVSPVRPFCSTLVDEGIVPRTVTPLQVDADGELLIEGETIEVYAGIEPIPDHLTRTVVQYYRHDMLQGPMTHKLEGAAVEQIEDARAANKGKKAPKKKERRDANESMPYSMQAIPPGTPLYAEIRLMDATEVEFAALGIALARWVRSGGHLGGASTKGHGACRIKVAGAIRYSAPVGSSPADPGTAVAVPESDTDAMARAYAAHLAERSEQIREYVAARTR